MRHRFAGISLLALTSSGLLVAPALAPAAPLGPADEGTVTAVEVSEAAVEDAEEAVDAAEDAAALQGDLAARQSFPADARKIERFKRIIARIRSRKMMLRELPFSSERRKKLLPMKRASIMEYHQRLHDLRKRINERDQRIREREKAKRVKERGAR
jgi:hypothetical protein